MKIGFSASFFCYALGLKLFWIFYFVGILALRVPSPGFWKVRNWDFLSDYYTDEDVGDNDYDNIKEEHGKDDHDKENRR